MPKQTDKIQKWLTGLIVSKISFSTKETTFLFKIIYSIIIKMINDTNCKNKIYEKQKSSGIAIIKATAIEIKYIPQYFPIFKFNALTKSIPTKPQTVPDIAPPKYHILCTSKLKYQYKK